METEELLSVLGEHIDLKLFEDLLSNKTLIILREVLDDSLQVRTHVIYLQSLQGGDTLIDGKYYYCLVWTSKHIHALLEGIVCVTQLLAADRSLRARAVGIKSAKHSVVVDLRLLKCVNLHNLA